MGALVLDLPGPGRELAPIPNYDLEEREVGVGAHARGRSGLVVMDAARESLVWLHGPTRRTLIEADARIRSAVVSPTLALVAVRLEDHSLSVFDLAGGRSMRLPGNSERLAPDLVPS